VSTTAGGVVGGLAGAALEKYAPWKRYIPVVNKKVTVVGMASAGGGAGYALAKWVSGEFGGKFAFDIYVCCEEGQGRSKPPSFRVVEVEESTYGDDELYWERSWKGEDVGMVPDPPSP
jgi:hypothetical protein